MSLVYIGLILEKAGLFFTFSSSVGSIESLDKINPFHATDVFYEVFWCFQGVSKEISGMTWVNGLE